jgi:hypothetical protein
VSGDAFFKDEPFAQSVEALCRRLCLVPTGLPTRHVDETHDRNAPEADIPPAARTLNSVRLGTRFNRAIQKLDDARPTAHRSANKQFRFVHAKPAG